MPEIITKELVELGDRIVNGLDAVNKTLIAYELDKHGLAPIETSDVNFYDYDGTVVASYSVEDFLAMTGMPKNPTHEELESRGWNWSFDDAQNYVKKYGKLEIGQMYRWKDVGSATKITIDIPEDGRLIVPLCFQQSITNGVSVDWGDGSEVETFEGTGVIETSHPYAEAGEYVITIDAAVDGVEIGFGDGVKTNILNSNYTDNQEAAYASYITKIVIGNIITEISDYAFERCCKLEKIVISDSITSIGQYAFYSSLVLQSLTIPDSVTSIGEYAFYSCFALRSLTIPDSVTSIGQYAFFGCYALQSLTISDSVTSISGYTFANCYTLQSLTIPDSVTFIGLYAFYGCYALKSLIIPDSVTSIGQYVFNGCYALQSLTIPDSVTSIGEYAFYSCFALQSLTIPDSVTSIEQHAFFSCYVLQSLTIPDSVTSIGERVFANCFTLRSLTISDSITSIGKNVFNGCFALQSLTIPDSVTSIGKRAFNGCHTLQSITLLSETPPTLVNADAFQFVPTDCVIYVPYSEDHSILNAYKTATNWSTYADMMVESDPE